MRQIPVAADQKIAADSPFAIDRFDVNTGIEAGALGEIAAAQSRPIAARFATRAIYDSRNGRWLGTWTPAEQGERDAGGISASSSVSGEVISM